MVRYEVIGSIVIRKDQKGLQSAIVLLCLCHEIHDK